MVRHEFRTCRTAFHALVSCADYPHTRQRNRPIPGAAQRRRGWSVKVGLTASRSLIARAYAPCAAIIIF